MSDERIWCFDIADEIGHEGEHCPHCHGGNIFDEDVCLDVKLADGRTVEACCDVRKALEAAGLVAKEDGK